MSLKLGVVMDPIDQINVEKDSTLALLFAAQKRHWSLYYFEQKDLFSRGDTLWGNARPLHVSLDKQNWFQFDAPETLQLHDLDVILMRKDPPFDLQYIYTTYLLELAEAKGTLIVNKPESLRSANEKMFTTWFPACTPPTLVARDATVLKEFIATHGDVVCKPLHSMGGSSVFRLQPRDHNTSVVIETLTECGTNYIMAQKFIPDIYEKGDKRIFIIDGEPFPYALARIPQAGEMRGNLAAGAKGVGVEITARDRWLCEQIGPTLKKRGLLFVGIDVIGDYVTEINVTSPTCIREIDQHFNTDVSALILDCIEKHKRADS